MQAIVLLNSAAGQLATPKGQAMLDTVSTALRAAEIDADLRDVPSHRLHAEAKNAAASSADVVVAGGGDGTIHTVSGALAGMGKPLGILPLGTLNHFAKDLKIPLDLTEAAQVIAAGNLSAVDLGVVNDQVFINNASLGVYPRAVLDRESQRSRAGLSKWTAMAVAVLKTFRRFPLVRVRLDLENQTVVRKTPLVFVGNNEYQLDLLHIGQRVCLDGGELSLYVAATETRWGMLKLTLRAMVGRLRQAQDFEALRLKECWIETRRRNVHVAVDGEVLKLRPPLHYRIWPAALSVFVPAKTAQEPVTVVGSDRLPAFDDPVRHAAGAK